MSKTSHGQDNIKGVNPVPNYPVVSPDPILQVSNFTLQVKVVISQKANVLAALIDSGSGGSFKDRAPAIKL